MKGDVPMLRALILGEGTPPPSLRSRSSSYQDSLKHADTASYQDSLKHADSLDLRGWSEEVGLTLAEADQRHRDGDVAMDGIPTGIAPEAFTFDDIGRKNSFNLLLAAGLDGDGAGAGDGGGGGFGGSGGPGGGNGGGGGRTVPASPESQLVKLEHIFGPEVPSAVVRARSSFDATVSALNSPESGEDGDDERVGFGGGGAEYAELLTMQHDMYVPTSALPEHRQQQQQQQQQPYYSTMAIPDVPLGLLDNLRSGDGAPMIVTGDGEPTYATVNDGPVGGDGGGYTSSAGTPGESSSSYDGGGTSPSGPQQMLLGLSELMGEDVEFSAVAGGGGIAGRAIRPSSLESNTALADDPSGLRLASIHRLNPLSHSGGGGSSGSGSEGVGVGVGGPGTPGSSGYASSPGGGGYGGFGGTPSSGYAGSNELSPAADSGHLFAGLDELSGMLVGGTSGAVGAAAAPLRVNRAMLNLQDSTGNTPLAWAARAEQLAVVQFLCAALADPNIANRNRESPLHTAALLHTGGCDDRCVLLLLRAGAKVDAVDMGGCTPLHHAAAAGAVLLVERLLAAGARPNHANYKGSTPLIQAAVHGHTTVISTLLAHGRDGGGGGGGSGGGGGGSGGGRKVKVDQQDSSGRTALHWAAAVGAVGCADLLVTSNPEFAFIEADNGDSPAHVAVRGDRADVLRRIFTVLTVHQRSTLVAMINADDLTVVQLAHSLMAIRCLALLDELAAAGMLELPKAPPPPSSDGAVPSPGDDGNGVGGKKRGRSGSPEERPADYDPNIARRAKMKGKRAEALTKAKMAESNVEALERENRELAALRAQLIREKEALTVAGR
jgi:hypothetical protein